MLIICAMPFALIGLAFWVGLWMSKKISLRTFGADLAGGAFLALVPVAWLLYYSAVHEGIVIAAADGDVEEVKFCLRMGASPNEDGEMGRPLAGRSL